MFSGYIAVIVTNTFLSFKIFIYMCGLGGHNISGHLPQKVQLQTACKTGEKKTAEKKNN